jgi:hypothetical protein
MAGLNLGDYRALTDAKTILEALGLNAYTSSEWNLDPNGLGGELHTLSSSTINLQQAEVFRRAILVVSPLTLNNIDAALATRESIEGSDRVGGDGTGKTEADVAGDTQAEGAAYRAKHSQKIYTDADSVGPHPEDAGAVSQNAGAAYTGANLRSSAIHDPYNVNTDHGGPDPFQGFDCEVWVQRADLAGIQNPKTGNFDQRAVANYLTHDEFDSGLTQGGMILLGQFTGVHISLRMTTEPYSEYDSRGPVYMDGEAQISWRLEKGLVNMDVLRETFGMSVFGRRVHFNVSPRLNITFNINTASFNFESDRPGQYTNELNRQVSFGSQPAFYTPDSGYVPEPLPSFTRHVNGRMVMKACKVDMWNMIAQGGRHVVSTDWSGVAEELVTLAGDPPQVSGKDTASRNTPGGLDTFAAARASTAISEIEIASMKKLITDRANWRAARLAALAGAAPEQTENVVDAEMGHANTTLPRQQILRAEALQRIRQGVNTAAKDITRSIFRSF